MGVIRNFNLQLGITLTKENHSLLICNWNFRKNGQIGLWEKVNFSFFCQNKTKIINFVATITTATSFLLYKMSFKLIFSDFVQFVFSKTNFVAKCSHMCVKHMFYPLYSSKNVELSFLTKCCYLLKDLFNFLEHSSTFISFLLFVLKLLKIYSSIFH